MFNKQNNISTLCRISPWRTAILAYRTGLRYRRLYHLNTAKRNPVTAPRIGHCSGRRAILPTSCQPYSLWQRHHGRWRQIYIFPSQILPVADTLLAYFIPFLQSTPAKIQKVASFEAPICTYSANCAFSSNVFTELTGIRPQRPNQQ